MKLKTLSIAASSVVIGSLLLTGCGNNSSSSSTSSSSGVSGTATKGYLSGSTVWIDLNGDGIVDSGETTTTNSVGFYSFSSSPTGTPILEVSGGVDSDSNSAFEGKLKAPFETGATEVILSPITTMVASLVEQGETNVTAAKTSIATSLGIPLNKVSVDPIAEAKKADGNTSILKTSLKIARLVELVSSKTTAGTATNYSKIMTGIAKQIKDSGTAIDSITVANIATNSGVTTLASDSEINKLSAAINTMTIPTGATASQIKASETATKLATQMLDKNTSASLNIDNIASIVTNLLTSIENNSSATLDINATATALSVIDTNTSDVNTTANSIKGAALTNKTAYEAAQVAAAAQAKIDAAKAEDKLKLKDNKVTIGSGSQSVTTTITNGTFQDVSHDTVAVNNLGSLYGLSFTLENVTDADSNAYASLEDGDDKNVTIALKIVDNNTSSNKQLLAVLKDVSLKRGVGGDNNTSNYNGEYTIAINSATKLYAWAKKSGGTIIKTSTSGITLTSDSVTSSSGVVTASVGSLVDQLGADSSFSSSISTIKNEFTQNGSYTVSTFISGIDGVVNSALGTASDVYTGFDDNSTIAGLFGTKISKVSGTVSVGLTTAQILAINQSAVDSASSALTLSGTSNATSNITLPLTQGSATVSWATSDSSVISASGAITRSETAGSATLTATISAGSGTTKATTTKTFSVTVAANPVSATNSSLSASSSNAYISGSAVTLTALVKYEDNTSASNKVVSFTGSSYGTLGSSSECTTNSSGQCSITYTGTSTGTETIGATVNTGATQIGSLDINVSTNPAYLVKTSSSTFTSASSTVNASDSVVLTAHVVSQADTNISNATVSFGDQNTTFGDLNSTTCTTDTNGQCSVSLQMKSYSNDSTPTVTINATYSSTIFGTLTIDSNATDPGNDITTYNVK